MAVYNYDSNTGNLTTVATSGQRTWVGTKAQHDAARAAGTLPNNALIALIDDEEDAQASNVAYDNTNSGISATNAQNAIDWAVKEIKGISGNIISSYMNCGFDNSSMANRLKGIQAFVDWIVANCTKGYPITGLLRFEGGYYSLIDAYYSKSDWLFYIKEVDMVRDNKIRTYTVDVNNNYSVSLSATYSPDA